MHLITVSKTTHATPEAVWELWSDLDKRRSWDDDLDRAALDPGVAFGKGATGSVTLKGQPPRKFEILECEPLKLYTDRFHLPLGGRMDWVHRIEQSGDAATVTFDVSCGGPTALLLAPIMKKILARTLPSTVDKLLKVAEGD